MEMKQLEAIWADSSTQWNFDFNHRNEIQESINNAINAQSDQVNICCFNILNQIHNHASEQLVFSTKLFNFISLQVLFQWVNKTKLPCKIDLLIVILISNF